MNREEQAELERAKERAALARKDARELEAVSQGLLAQMPKWVGVPVEVGIGLGAAVVNGGLRKITRGSPLGDKHGGVNILRTGLGTAPLLLTVLDDPDLTRLGTVASVGMLAPEVAEFTEGVLDKWMASATDAKDANANASPQAGK